MARLMLKTAGEIGIKSPRTRRRFVRMLRRNARRALQRAGVSFEVESGWGRFFVETPDPQRARDVLSRVFGFHSVAEVVTLPFEGLDDLVARAAAVHRDRVAGRTFAVETRRAGVHGFRSSDVNRALGSALLHASAGVNLNDPEVAVRLEIVSDRAHVVLAAVPGAGGLPVGTAGRAVALFSGGFDSPVATWMAMSRGLAVDLVVYDLGGCAQTDGALSVAKAVATRWASGVEPRAHIIDLLPVVAALTQHVDPPLRQVLLRRAMFRVGTLAARHLGAEALVTGESLGQASTQTLQNLAVSEEAAGIPVLRPLLGIDKDSIVARARTIGTHDASMRVKEYCSISTGPVETAARPAQIAAAERHLGDALVSRAVAGRREVDLVEWVRGPLPGYVVEDRPEDAVVVDLREPDEGPAVGDLRLPFSRAGEWMGDLDPETTYLFVCSVGVRSEQIAEQLHGRGYRAYCLAGGVHRLGSRAA